MSRYCSVLFITAFAVLMTANVMSAAPQATEPPAVADAISSGRATFRTFCTPCHGAAGKGDGPVAPLLIKAPPDVTQVRRRHGGVFPRAEFESILLAPTRSAAPAAMSTQMILWGPIFLSMHSEPAAARAKVADLLAFLESIQEN